MQGVHLDLDEVAEMKLSLQRLLSYRDSDKILQKKKSAFQKSIESQKIIEEEKEKKVSKKQKTEKQKTQKNTQEYVMPELKKILMQYKTGQTPEKKTVKFDLYQTQNNIPTTETNKNKSPTKSTSKKKYDHRKRVLENIAREREKRKKIQPKGFQTNLSRTLFEKYERLDQRLEKLKSDVKEEQKFKNKEEVHRQDSHLTIYHYRENSPLMKLNKNLSLSSSRIRSSSFRNKL